jgi:hypothetical protein
MKLNINDFVAYTVDDTTFVGQLKKIVITEEGTHYFISFQQGEKWQNVSENALKKVNVSFVEEGVNNV